MKVRFWVAPPDFRVLSLDATSQSEGRLEVLFENPDALTGHTVLWNGEPAAGNWRPLSVLSWSAETNRTRRVEVPSLPEPRGGFLRVVAP
jgi:hypothetical protein